MPGHDFQREKEKLKEINISWEHGDDICVFLRNIHKLKDQLDDEYGIEQTVVQTQGSEEADVTEDAALKLYD